MAVEYSPGLLVDHDWLGRGQVIRVVAAGDDDVTWLEIAFGTKVRVGVAQETVRVRVGDPLLHPWRST